MKNIIKDTYRDIAQQFGVLNDILLRKLINEFPSNIRNRLLNQKKESFL